MIFVFRFSDFLIIYGLLYIQHSTVVSAVLCGCGVGGCCPWRHCWLKLACKTSWPFDKANNNRKRKSFKWHYTQINVNKWLVANHCGWTNYKISCTVLLKVTWTRRIKNRNGRLKIKEGTKVYSLDEGQASHDVEFKDYEIEK